MRYLALTFAFGLGLIASIGAAQAAGFGGCSGNYGATASGTPLPSESGSETRNASS